MMAMSEKNMRKKIGLIKVLRANSAVGRLLHHRLVDLRAKVLSERASREEIITAINATSVSVLVLAGLVDTHADELEVSGAIGNPKSFRT